MKKAAQQFQNQNPFICKNFDCVKLAVAENDFCPECKDRKTSQKRGGRVIATDFADAIKDNMETSGLRTPSTPGSGIPEITLQPAEQTVVEEEEPTKLSSSALFTWNETDPLSNSAFGTFGDVENIPTIPSLQSSAELPPQSFRQGSIDDKLRELTPLITSPKQNKRPTSDIIYITYSPTKNKRPFSIATETPSTSTPQTGSTLPSSILDPNFNPRIEPSSLSRRGATKRASDKKTEENQQGSGFFSNIKNIFGGDDVQVKKVDGYDIYEVEDNPVQEEGLEAILDYYDGETSEKIEDEDENIRKRLTQSIYFGLQELEQLRQMLPDLDKEADEGLEAIAEEVEEETQEIENEEENVRQSIFIDGEAQQGLQEIYRQEATKKGTNFNPNKFFQGVKKGVIKVKETGQTVAERTKNSKGFQIAGKVGGVVFNPTTANITKIVAGEVLKAMPGGLLVNSAVTGAFNAAERIKQQRQELKNIQEKTAEITEQKELIETEITEIQSDVRIDTIESKVNTENIQVENIEEVETDNEEAIFEDEESEEEIRISSKGDIGIILDTVGSVYADMESIVKAYNSVSYRLQDLDIRMKGFGNYLNDSMRFYNKKNDNLTAYIRGEFLKIHAEFDKVKSLEGNRFNAISDSLKTISSGVLDPKADFGVGEENNDNSLPTPLTQPFDMKKTAYDIRDEVLNVKSDISKVNTWIEKQEKDRDQGVKISLIILAVILVPFILFVIYDKIKNRKSKKQVNNEN